jgi:hypothetical protein
MPLKRTVSTFVIAFALIASITRADERHQNLHGAKAIVELSQALTAGSLFGAPRYATVLLPPCTTSQKGATAFDTTANALVVCDGSVWASPGGGGGVTIGTTALTSGTSGRVIFDNAGVVGEDADLTFSGDTLTATQIVTKAGSAPLSTGGVICKGAPNTTSAGTVETVLATCTIPANTLTANGSMLRYRYIAHTAANGNLKQLHVRIGGSAGSGVCSTGSSGNGNNQTWTTHGDPTAVRNSSTSVVAECRVAQGQTNTAAVPANVASFFTTLTRVVDWSIANDLVFDSSAATGAGDLTLDTYIVEVIP